MDHTLVQGKKCSTTRKFKDLSSKFRFSLLCVFYVLMVIETILNPNYFDQPWLNDFINAFKVQNVTIQIIVISVIAGIGIFHLL